MNWTIVIVVLTLSIFVAIIGVVALLNRGKQLKCPDCNQVFNAPVMEEKLSGLGFTFPYTGVVKCPKCGNKRSRRDYKKPE
ncbi:MAG: zinc-ribbon domain-containing protein [Candidatus Bathyarchaeota archaeon]|nr:zinc-ribbon domain-containing protein [Candidatus Termiticorpusculum sp.]